MASTRSSWRRPNCSAGTLLRLSSRRPHLATCSWQRRDADTCGWPWTAIPPWALLTSRCSAATRRGHLWVALDGDSPVGFAHVEMLGSDRPHLDEIDVHPAHGRRGLGTRLVGGVCEWAAASGYQQITLTTFRLVPWNRTCQRNLGFVA